jgi:protein-S-isoprenylcysteine O-methyltransferase
MAFMAASCLAFFSIAFLPLGTTLAQSAAGLVIVVLGQSLRTAAMWTAGVNFNHIIANKLRDGHRLVTHGVYR